jgi:NADH-quinone oxidoreductase subunit K
VNIVPFSHVLSLAVVLFAMGVFCLVGRRNLIMMLLGLEIMLNAASIAFIGASLHWQHMDGQAMVLFIMAVAATEVSVGLALIVAIYRNTGSVDPEEISF